MFIALYIKERSREIVKIEFAEQIKSVLAIFKMDLLESLDKKYARSDSLDSRDDRLDIFDTRFEVLEARVTSLEKHGR
jgi:hypothetical protein